MLKFSPTTRNLLLFAPNLILVVNKHMRHMPYKCMAVDRARLDPPLPPPY